MLMYLTRGEDWTGVHFVSAASEIEQGLVVFKRAAPIRVNPWRGLKDPR
jgi:hypothetical protein